jgi:hypothetical protein
VQSGADHLENAARVFKHVIVPEAEDSEASRPEVRIASAVAAALRVMPAIRFNDQRSFKTDEIHDVGCDDVLPADLEPRHSTIAEHEPQSPLSRYRVRAHLARAVA